MDGTVEYANFRAWVPRNVLSVGTLNPQDWVYYDWGPRQVAEPLLCLHPVVGSAESFYLICLSLSQRGYRVISPQIPVYWSTPEFCDGLQMFLDMLHVRRVHVYGAGLGGFLGLYFAARRPERVASIALTHSFLSTSSVEHNIIYSPSVLRWLPDILVRNAVRSMFPRGKAELVVAEAAEFVIARTMACSREELASRLALLVTESTVVGRLRISDERVTMIDVFGLANRMSTPIAEESTEVLSNARQALLKTGGDFPYLANSEDVAMHLVVHLRRNGAPPSEPLPPPPPAKPRPSAYARRKGDDSPSASEKDDEASPCDSTRELRRTAKEQVMALEREREETFAPQLAKIRPFVPDRDDEFLVAVLHDCEGDADQAVARIRDGHYRRRFHIKARRKAIREAFKVLRAERATSKEEAQNAASATPVKDQETDAGLQSIGLDAQVSADAAAAVASVADHEIAVGSIGGSDERIASDTSGTVNDVAPSAALADVAPPEASLETVFVPEGSGDAFAPSPRKRADGVPALASGATLDDSSAATFGEYEAGSKGGGDRRRKSRSLSKRDRYPPETDSVSAYVTSEKVGMKSTASLIGRGPAPLKVPVSDQDVCLSPGAAGQVSHSSSPAVTVLTSNSEGVTQDSIGLEPRLDTSLPPSQPQVSGLSRPGRRLSQAHAPSTSHESPAARSAPAGSEVGAEDNDDGWAEFRQGALLQGAFLSSNDSVEVGKSGLEMEGNAGELMDSVDDETARLREWMMSAQSATESVQSTRPK